MPRDSNCWHCGESLAGSVVALVARNGQTEAPAGQYIAVSAGFTAPMLGKKLVSTT